MDKNKSLSHVHHEFPIYINHDSQILILGSMPSIVSRKQGFYYGHKNNRFWAVLVAIFGESIPQSLEEKKDLLQKHKIALFDVIKECDIHASSDSSIKNVIPNNIDLICRRYPIKKIILNGKKAESLFYEYIHVDGVEVISLPSTSSANAQMSLKSLVEKYEQVLIQK